MREPASTPDRRGVTAYVCAKCTNRFHTYAETPPSPCAVCGGDRWKAGGGSTLAAADRAEPSALRVL